MMANKRSRNVSDDHTRVRADVVQAAIDGDLDAVRAVWQAHRRWAAAILLAHKPRESDLEDLLQELATTMVRTIGKLRDPGALKPWLRTTAINAAREAGRSVRRRRLRFTSAGSAAIEQSTVEGGASEAVSKESAKRLMELARSLDEGYREPLLPRCVRGMSYRQISEVMGLPESTIETRIARGRRMLRDLAASDQGLSPDAVAGSIGGQTG
jgi:RNA polymerase sigma-70 factor (ECF subfamily)